MATAAKKANRRARRKQLRQRSDVVFAAADIKILPVEGEQKTPSMRVVAYTGDLLHLPNFPHPAVINLAGVRAMNSEQLPFLRDHAVRRPIGHGTPKITASNLQHDGDLSIESEDRDEVVNASGNGFRWQASVGGRIPDLRKDTQLIKAGERVRVNDRTFSGPIVVINAFLWKETSVTAVGADEGVASAAIAASHHRVNPMNEFDKWLEDQGIDSANLTASQVANLKAAWEAMTAGPANVAANNGGGTAVATEIDVEEIIRTATESAVRASQEQNQRTRRVENLFANYNVPQDRADDLRAQYDSGELNEDRLHVRLMEAERATGSTSNNAARGGGYGPQRNMEIMASLGSIGGLSEDQVHAMMMEEGCTEDQAEAAVTRGKKRFGLKSLIRAVCHQEGHHVDEVDDEAIGVAIHASRRDFNPANVQASSGGWSAASVVGILSRLANKAMLAAYAEADNGGVATRICSTTTTRDFKKFTRYRMTEAGIMEEVPATGEIPHGKLTQEEYENQVKTYGKMFALTRQMIRNDDLDAFLQIPRMLGRMGRHGLEQATIKTLNEAPVGTDTGFFQSAPTAGSNRAANYLVGANTNLSLDSLEPAYELFLDQIDSDGKPIGIDPELLLVSNGDIITARKLYTDTQYRFTTADRSETINNQWEGMFEPLKSAYLHRVGGGTKLQYYLMSRPTTDVAAVQIAFLDGIQAPTINQAETAFNTLGVQMRGYFDWGVALQDYRAAVKVKGAA